MSATFWDKIYLWGQEHILKHSWRHCFHLGQQVESLHLDVSEARSIYNTKCDCGVAEEDKDDAIEIFFRASLS